jgi:hypothetical protein
MAKATSRGLGRKTVKVEDSYAIGFKEHGLKPDTHKFEVGKTYHGTGGGVEGGVIRPMSAADGGRDVFGTAAYGLTATENPQSMYHAVKIAREKAGEQGRLFGEVHEVEPISNDADSFVRNDDTTVGRDQHYVRDTRGLRVTRSGVAFPLNPTAVSASQQFADAKQRQQEWLNKQPDNGSWV